MRKEELAAMPQSVQEYVTHLRVIKGKSDLTTLEYASDLRTFFVFLKKAEESPLPIVHLKKLIFPILMMILLPLLRSWMPITT